MYSLPQDPTVILVIDEDALTLMGMAATLDIEGYECHCAQDGEAAHKAARSLNLDLIICDVSVDGQRGLELCQALRREPGKEDVPIVFVSSGAIPDMVRRKQDLGATYYLRKPLDPDVLVEVVAKALWMPHLIRARAEQAGSHSLPRRETHSTHPADALHRHEDLVRVQRGTLSRDSTAT
jgi:CheY-like chemotaxis protein